MAITILILMCRAIGLMFMTGALIHHGINGGFDDGYMAGPDSVFSFLVGGFTVGLLWLFAPEWVPALGKLLGRQLPTADNLRALIREEVESVIVRLVPGVTPPAPPAPAPVAPPAKAV